MVNTKRWLSDMRGVCTSDACFCFFSCPPLLSFPPSPFFRASVHVSWLSILVPSLWIAWPLFYPCLPYLSPFKNVLRSTLVLRVSIYSPLSRPSPPTMFGFLTLVDFRSFILCDSFLLPNPFMTCLLQINFAVPLIVYLSCRLQTRGRRQHRVPRFASPRSLCPHLRLQPPRINASRLRTFALFWIWAHTRICAFAFAWGVYHFSA